MEQYPKICGMKLISIQIRSFTLLENVKVSALAITRLRFIVETKRKYSGDCLEEYCSVWKGYR